MDHAQLGEKCWRTFLLPQLPRYYRRRLELAWHKQSVTLLDPLRGFCLFFVIIPHVWGMNSGWKAHHILQAK